MIRTILRCVALFLLLALYLAAWLAPVVVPHSHRHQFRDFSFAPPSRIVFQSGTGAWTPAFHAIDHRGINRRFVVTNRDDLCSQSLYDHYTDRGQTENFIKAFKNHLSMDRLSCHRFLANQFRLLLHALAYQMFVRLRDYLHGTPWHKLEIETLRRRVLKIGARIRQTTRRIWVHLSSAFPEQPLFHLVLSRLNSS